MTRHLGAVVLAAVAAIGAGCGSSDPTPGMAEVMCEDFVDDRLRSPSSAEFPDPVTRKSGTQTWVVEGAVDSENGFGAMIRSTYTCEVRYAGDDVWRLVDLQFVDGGG
ncbi:hypothetical protein [Microcystis phage MinS1]|nr:hypothetical protein [Microcystis phage MinS1]